MDDGILKTNEKNKDVNFLINCAKEQKISEWNNYKKTTNEKINIKGIEAKNLNLTGIDLSELDLENAIFDASNLFRANLAGSNLKKASFISSNLQGANLKSTDLEEADFQWADLQYTNLAYSNINKTDFRNSLLEEAKINLADDRNSKFDGTCYEIKPIYLEDGINDTTKRSIYILQKRIQEKEQRINELERQKETLTKTSKDEIETTQKEIEKEIEKAKIELKYEDKLTQIQIAVDTLKKPAFELKKAKSRAQLRVNFFNYWAAKSIKVSMAGFALYGFAYISTIFLSNRIDTSGYFVMIFPIIFPIIMALALYRQANIKTKEIAEIDKRLILIHEINQALTATVEINKNNPDAVDKKAENILERLTDNILTWNKPKEAEKESDSLLPKEIIDAIETIKKFGKSDK